MFSVLRRVYSRSPLPLPSPSPRPKIKYDVFISFRGDDTRNNFTSHLYKAFCDKGIYAFIDYQLRRGDEISPSLLQAIEESLISVVIFSNNFADSRWCLEELVKILECKKNHQQIVIPVFYEIDPSHVRHQTGSYAVAFDNHEQRFNEDLDKVQKWRDALKEAANLSGFDSRLVVPETVLVEKIIEDVLESLDNMPSSDNKELVEIESKIREIEVMLGMGDQTNNDVRRIGIWGTGGIGKTTLARAVCNKIFHQFERFHFIENVREDLEKMGVKCLRQELYLAILGDKNVYNHLLIKKRFSRMKLLIILDDVSSINQVDDLFGDLDCFGLGSRIIITSRDQQMLKYCGVDYIYEVKELSFHNARKLFYQHAFKQNYPRVDDMELLGGVVQKVGGVPLALKVLGCFLRDKKKEVWESSMKKLENSLDNNIYDKLKISYDGLDPDQQRLFLDIVYFYKGWDINLVITIMDANGFCTDNELSALEDKCLITKSNNTLMIHDLLQAMGKRIVQQESTDPGERTRLCNHDDICDVLTNATGTKKMEGISLDMSNIGDIHLHPDAFVSMPNLRFLQFYISNYLRYNNQMHVPQELKFHLTKLRYFEWERCPLESLQSNSHFENLVILKLTDSNVEQLWSGVQQFDHLKEIVVSGSRKLIRFPYLKAPRLEHLNLDGCVSLIEMPSSFQHLSRLMTLSLSSCNNLTSVPQLPNNLERLYLSYCCSLIEIPSSIQHLTRLIYLHLTHCESLTCIPDCSGLISLRDLDLSYCSKLKRFPEIPDNFQVICLEGCYSLFEIPSSLKLLNKLEKLTFKSCESPLRRLGTESRSKAKVLPELPNNLQELHVIECGITEIPDSVGYLTSLLYLELDGNKFERIPESIINLSNLTFLSIRDCKRLKVLPKLPWADVDASNCASLEELSCPSFPNDIIGIDSNYNRFMSAKFANCFKLDQNSLDSFVKNAQREIEAQSPSCCQVYDGKRPPLHICYPGHEIPEWFDFQSTGSFVDVKLSLDGFDCNVLCFALCAVVSFPGQFALPNNLLGSSSAYVRYKCYVKSKEVDHNWNKMSGLLGGFLNSADCSTGSNYVIIGFGFHFLRELHDNEFTFKFFSSKEYKQICKVEKCGVHLICGKHFEKSDQNERLINHMVKNRKRKSNHISENSMRQKRLKHNLYIQETNPIDISYIHQTEESKCG